MLIQHANPKGVDVFIQQLQTWLHDQLLIAWGADSVTPLPTAQYMCYERCYRNKTTDGSYVAQVFTGGSSNNGYELVYWDSSLSALSFFGIGAATSFNQQHKVPVHLVFFVDLKKLKPSLAYRGDDEVRNDVINLLKYPVHGFSYTGFELYLENVLREYPGSRRDNGLLTVDMHPTHCFRINLELRYDNNQNCTPFKSF